MKLGLKRKTGAALRAFLKRSILSNDQRRICQYRGHFFFADARNKVEARLIAGDYDEMSMSMLSMIIKQGHVCADIGANVGAYSVMMSAMAGHGGAVHAFEPVNHIRRRALLNLQLNGCRNVIMNDCALGDRSGSTRMLQVKEGEFRGGTSSMLETEAITQMGRDHFDEVDVAVKTLDDYIDETGLDRLDFMKIDVEGFELSVLNGATKVLSAMRPVLLFEHDRDRLQRVGLDEEAFKDIFHRHNYVVVAPTDLGSIVTVSEYRFDGNGARRDMLALPL